ncbi:MAG TPA: MlaD family protein [Pseudonocardiaceae bacterium]|jgi:phospholipid/cholesterol/gamma-HCH transport system substrate-binding protein|nr:MlaD family protein [Pseudonocardiaceae bacterium]
MLSTATRVKIIAFIVIGITVIVYIGLRYADLGRYIGLPGYYVVHVDLSQTGGAFPNGDVTYRGVTVGRIGEINLTPTGVEIDLDINDSAPPIPESVQAVVADRSAVGEQYIDLRPKDGHAPYLTANYTIPERDTQTPLPVQDLLSSIDGLASSVPTQSLQTVVDELDKATQGQGPNLQTLLDTSGSLTKAATNDLPQTTTLINDGQTVLQTQAEEGDALQDFGRNAELLARQLDSSDPDIRKLIGTAPEAATQLSGLLQDTTPSLGALLANLLTTADVAVTRENGITEFLYTSPAAIAAGSTVITANGANFGIIPTFYNPPSCTQGYGSTVYRNGLDTSPGAGLNVNASCASAPGSGIDVRGSANAPNGGGVPPAAAPQGLGVIDSLTTDEGSSAATTPTTLRGLLGLDP